MDFLAVVCPDMWFLKLLVCLSPVHSSDWTVT